MSAPTNCTATVANVSDSDSQETTLDANQNPDTAKRARHNSIVECQSGKLPDSVINGVNKIEVDDPDSMYSLAAHRPRR